MPRLTIASAVTVLALASGSANAAPTADELAATYEQLQRWRCSVRPEPVPSGGIELQLEDARVVLESGTLRLLEPTAAGALTGLRFEGRGRFTMAVADPVERAQLARFARRPGMTSIDTAFDALVLRTSESLLAAMARSGNANGAAYGPCEPMADRHVSWLTIEGIDADARVVAGLADPRDGYVRAELTTPELGRLTYEYDGSRREEITLGRFSSAGGFPFVETWLSLDRAADRRADGRPGSRVWAPFAIPHVELAVDLQRSGREARQGRSDTDEVNAGMVATLTVRGSERGVRTLPLALDAQAKVLSVQAPDGTPLRFLRDPLGARSSLLHDWLYDDALLILLDRPLEPGEERKIAVAYDLNLRNYAPGGASYPTIPERLARHTARLTITAPERREIRAMGSLASRTAADGLVTTVWDIAEPTPMVTFSFAEKFREERIVHEGVPEIVVFASARGSGKAKMWNVGADVANCAAFLQELLASPLEGDRLIATSILAGHGQSFSGFLHLSEDSFYMDQRGPSELFRCHETAHQWWGHRVGFATYRDQWLSEAFAEYSALLFLEAQPNDGPKLFAEALETSAAEVLGSIKMSMSRFARSWSITINDVHRARLGPISLGSRASTAEVPAGYLVQSYQKGSLVLHMLRTLLRNASHSDDLFVSILRDFVAAHAEGEASTADFAAAVARHAPGDWHWFFDQWVDGTAIPTYTWSHSLAPAAGASGAAGSASLTTLTLRVRQSGAPAGFRMPVPVRLELADGRSGQVVVLVQKADETFSIPLAERPRKVVFNPDLAVLAIVKKG